MTKGDLQTTHGIGNALNMTLQEPAKMSAPHLLDIEWFVPDPSVAVRQGDILICRDPRSGRVEEVCVVITADCDISKGKFGRQLACLRIVHLDDYIQTIWASRKLEKALRDETEKLRGQVAKWHTRLLGSDSSLSAEALTAWVRREDPACMCESLQVRDEDRKKLIAALTSFRNALSSLDSNECSGKLSQYVAFRAASHGQDIHVLRRDVLQQAQKESLPEDVFLLPSLPQLEGRAAVVMLREVVGIAYEAVCYRAADARTSDRFLRIGRLQPTFKYAVSQAFGTLYSRIGLPDAYEARCKNAIENISNLARE
jgi:hypothetical protein